MIYLSAGHNLRLSNGDPGAVYGIIKEAVLTAELRDLITVELKKLRATFITDTDSETLKEYITRIKPGTGSVVCELHFNSSQNLATGTEVLIKNEYCNAEKELATSICNLVSSTCGIINRGVKTEARLHRVRLGILNTQAGISVLPEICFINNKRDMEQYNKNKSILAALLARQLYDYDLMYS